MPSVELRDILKLGDNGNVARLTHANGVTHGSISRGRCTVTEKM
jgi:hypothetical protein